MGEITASFSKNKNTSKKILSKLETVKKYAAPVSNSVFLTAIKAGTFGVLDIDEKGMERAFAEGMTNIGES